MIQFRKMIQFRIAYGRRLYGLLCRHTVAGAMCGALCELLLYNIVVARCVALYGRRRYFLYKISICSFRGLSDRFDVLQLVRRLLTLCGVSDPAAVWILSGSAGRPRSSRSVRRIVSACGLDLSGVLSDHAAGCQSSGVLS